MNVLVLDCGGSALKATVFGADGRVLASVDAASLESIVAELSASEVPTHVIGRVENLGEVSVRLF